MEHKTKQQQQSLFLGLSDIQEVLLVVFKSLMTCLKLATKVILKWVNIE